MDVNGMPIEGFYSTNLPAGLGAAPPLSAALAPVDEHSAEEHLSDGAAGTNAVHTDAMTESEMEGIILEYKAAQSAKEAQRVLENRVPAEQMDKVLGGLEEDLFS